MKYAGSRACGAAQLKSFTIFIQCSPLDIHMQALLLRNVVVDAKSNSRIARCGAIII